MPRTGCGGTLGAGRRCVVRRFLWVSYAALLLASIAIAPSGGSTRTEARWVITDLGTLGGPGSEAVAINNRGQIVGSSDTKGDEEIHVVLWQKGKKRDLGTLGGTYGAAYDINERGQIAGSASTKANRWDPTHAFLWENGKMRDLGTLGGRDSEAVAINESGQIVGSSMTKGGVYHAFLWENGKMRDLGTFGGKSSKATAINDRGQIVGTMCKPSWVGKCRAFLWEKGRVLDLGVPGGSATDINDRGQVVGWGRTTENLAYAFIWQRGKTRELGVSSERMDEAIAEAVNERGQVVGANWEDLPHGGGRGFGFFWQNGQMSALRPLQRGIDSSAMDINGHGSVVGTSSDVNDSHAVLWTPKR
jgi:probable HAF family extracellular repeat protein